jgi:hypothetical protein
MPFQSDPSVRPPLFDGKIEQGILIGITGIQSAKSRTPRVDKSAKIYKEFDEDLTCRNVRRLRRNNIFCLNVS